MSKHKYRLKAKRIDMCMKEGSIYEIICNADNNVRKVFFYRRVTVKVIDRGVIWKSTISGVCMPKNNLSLLFQNV